MAMTAKWTRVVTDPTLQRSSHTINVVDQKAYIFGGELLPRQPRDNKMISLDLKPVPVAAAKHPSALVTELSFNGNPPPPRVGSASTAMHGKVYMFSGRGGEAMTPLEEEGLVWVFDTQSSTWSSMQSASSQFPQGRSYHCATNDGGEHVYIHAGCPASGRLSDLWKFHLPTRMWTQCPSAPGPARGGASIAFNDGKLYRMNGFDGETEQGGAIDVFNLRSETWSSINFTTDGKTGPGSRSVGTLLPVTIHDRPCLVTLFGEGDPSAHGHAGAGKMFGDVWTFDLHKEKWEEVQIANPEHAHPLPRGWFDADSINGNRILVSGGLGEENDRLPDAWILSF